MISTRVLMDATARTDHHVRLHTLNRNHKQDHKQCTCRARATSARRVRMHSPDTVSRLAVREEGLWSSCRIGVEADADRALADRIVVRDWVELREKSINRRLTLHRRNHKAFLEGRHRGEPPDRFDLRR